MSQIMGYVRNGDKLTNSLVSFSPAVCGLRSCEPGTVTQAFKSSKGREYSQFITCASSQEENGL